IPREADAGSRVEEMAGHAARIVVRTNRGAGEVGQNRSRDGSRSALATALHDAVEGVAADERAVERIVWIGWIEGAARFRARRESCRAEAECALIALTVRTEEADAQTQVQGQIFRNAPVILEIGLEDFVTVVVLVELVPLLVARHISHQQVGKRVAGALR